MIDVRCGVSILVHPTYPVWGTIERIEESGKGSGFQGTGWGDRGKCKIRGGSQADSTNIERSDEHIRTHGKEIEDRRREREREISEWSRGKMDSVESLVSPSLHLELWSSCWSFPPPRILRADSNSYRWG